MTKGFMAQSKSSQTEMPRAGFDSLPSLGGGGQAFRL